MQIYNGVVNKIVHDIQFRPSINSKYINPVIVNRKISIAFLYFDCIFNIIIMVTMHILRILKKKKYFNYI